MFFSDGFNSNGIVSLNGAKIFGNLNCSGALFENIYNIALRANQAQIGGSIYFNSGFRSNGYVDLMFCNVGGNFDCEGGHFKNPNGIALSCDGIKVNGGLFFREGTCVIGHISLAHSKITTLADSIECWPSDSLDLDGFCYERIAASSALDAKSRVNWLSRQKKDFLSDTMFAVQPWVHLAHVLREQGHFREAAEVDIAREEQLRAAGKIGDPQWARLDNQGNYVTFLSSLDDYFSYFFHWLYGFVSGYGHKPRRIFYSAAILWFFCALVFHLTADTASFTLSNPAAVRILRDDCDKKFASQNLDLMRCAEQLKTYPRFSPWAYSFDLILPVVRLGQSTTWAPTWDAVWTQRLVWFEEIFGWVAALTLAAIAAGLVKRKDG